MRVLIVEPQKEPYVKEISNCVETMMEVVGGEHVVICPYEDPRVALIFSKGAKRKKLASNQLIWSRYFRGVIYGTFFVCLKENVNLGFLDLPDSLIEEYTQKFKDSPIKFKVI